MSRTTLKYTTRSKSKCWKTDGIEPAVTVERGNKMKTLKVAMIFEMPRSTMRGICPNDDVSSAHAVAINLPRKPIFTDRNRKVSGYLSNSNVMENY